MFYTLFFLVKSCSLAPLGLEKKEAVSELTFGGHSQSVFSVSGCPTSQPEDRILNNIFDLSQSKHEPNQAR